MSRPLKPSMSAQDHITLLRRRGMKVDESQATQWLSNVSYHRLSAYWYPARRLNAQGRRDDSFVDGTSFVDVAALYETDRKLRALVLDGMERVEITMRTRLGELLCQGGPLSYQDPANFRPEFGHSSWLDTARKRTARAERDNEAIKHYKHEYAASYPFWVLAEVLDFRDVSRLFEGLPLTDQKHIAKGLGITPNLGNLSSAQRKRANKSSPLVRWLEQLTVVRNTCAHHGRLWNKSFVPAPTAALRTQRDFAALPDGQSERIFGTLVMMSHLLRVTSPGTSWPEKVARLIRDDFVPNGLVTPSAMGVPERWNGEL